jgi:hypothetical protein
MAPKAASWQEPLRTVRHTTESVNRIDDDAALLG